MIDQLTPYAPYVLYAAVAGLLAWSQKDRLASLWGWLKPAPGPEPEPTPSPDSLTPAERFDLYYRLRCWCSTAGHMAAVDALDEKVLPVLAKGEGVP